MKKFLLPFGLALALFASSGRASTTSVKWVSVAHLDSQGQTVHGYLPHRFDIYNSHLSLPFEVRVALVNYNGRSLEKTVTVPPGRQMRTTIYEPAAGFGNLNSFTVSVAGLGSSQPVHFSGRQHGGRTHYSYSPSGSAGVTTLLFSRRFKTETYTDALAKALSAAGAPPATHYPMRGSGGGPAWVTRADDEIETWPGDWLAYSAYDAVAIHDEEYQRCRETPVWDGLQNYLAGGGGVAIFGAAADSSESVGFGRLLHYRAALPEELPGEALTALHTDLGVYAGFWSTRMNVGHLHSQLPILDTLDIPFRSFMGTMALFAILMGPVSIGILTRKNRRIWLLWVIPAISLATSAFVYFGNLAREGTGKTAAARGMVFLDQRRNVATSISWAGFYSPRTVKALTYPTTAEVTPLGENYGRRSRGSGSGSVVFGDRQSFVDGWMQTRIPEYFAVRDTAPNRERIQIEKDGPDYYVLNGLSAGLKEFRVNLKDSGVWQCRQELPPGAKMKLAKASGNGATALRDIFAYGNDFSRRLSAAAIRLDEGCYAAESLAPYLVTNGVENGEALKGSCVVAGRLEAN